MRSFDISLRDERIIEVRSKGVSRADCVLIELAGGRDLANPVLGVCASRSGNARDGSYCRQEHS
ncbi:MAG: hypothetical protein CPDRYMAC_1333 [uncultured Paraburkholderia sp.]|nr:MAG: hypothetical protein CPDRYDRY_1418 [uncultured Paraburkholderia sp.]CAH2917841.1 MAG: hypothetical protein CPDRYMAC_1333 [uncultured Paraburkholderia sp.]